MHTRLLGDFLEFVRKHQLMQTDDKLLVGISGGLDSMVLGHLLLDAGYDFDVAHVNFHLRGQESDGDATFVKRFADENGLNFHQLDVDTDAFAKAHKISIQQAARQLRYEWLEKKRKEVGASWILVAHQKNDIAETMIFNWIRGSGMAGLHGIKSKSGHLVRPLLFAERQDILAYAKENDVTWREDSSNQKTKYARNLIRHKVLPLLESINPAVIQNLAHNAQIMSELELMLEDFVETIRQKYMRREAQEIRLDLKAIRALPSAKSVLYYLLKEYGFNESLVVDILGAKETGKVFLSGQKRAVIHGDSLLVTDFAEDTGVEYQLEAWRKMPIDTPEFELSWTVKNYHGQRPPEEDGLVWLAKDRMVFPLVLRKRKAGDRFQPFGMGGRSKKLKDFLSNLKLSLPEKEKIWVLESGDGKICWVVGLRIDERFKVLGSTQEILELKIARKL
ncbi:MAG TPA: tRNA lysidine(34) synthetase TilS [Saprospiraceae bacterium]|nr:tRNA lysidine(34) synthetase TilS [Saprospiraceae bacterium]